MNNKQGKRRKRNGGMRRNGRRETNERSESFVKKQNREKHLIIV